MTVSKYDFKGTVNKILRQIYYRLMKYVIGIDGSRGGWVAVLRNSENENIYDVKFAKDLSTLLKPNIDLALIDMPIGLDNKAKPGGRSVDKIARKFLIKRKSSIFNAPSRYILEAKNYKEANKINKMNGLGLSKQSWNLIPKIIELEKVLHLKERPKIYESHPEICFQVMNGKELKHSKKEDLGINERKGILSSNGFNKKFLKKFISQKGTNYQPDDFLDACALSWSALRVAKEININLPEDAHFDKFGILMQMKI